MVNAGNWVLDSGTIATAALRLWVALHTVQYSNPHTS